MRGYIHRRLFTSKNDQLMYAIRNHQEKTVAALVEDEDVDVNYIEKCSPDRFPAKYYFSEFQNHSPLQVAVQYGNNLSMIKKLISKGANINYQDEYGNTALHYLNATLQVSAKIARPDIAIELLKNKINLKLKNHAGRTALLEIISSRSIPMSDISTLVKAICEHLSLEEKQQVIDAVNYQYHSGLTFAIQPRLDHNDNYGHDWKTVNLLLDYGAHFDVEDIIYAAGNGNCDIVKRMLNRVHDFDRFDQEQLLESAIKSRDTEMVKLFLQKGVKYRHIKPLWKLVANDLKLLNVLLKYESISMSGCYYNLYCLLHEKLSDLKLQPYDSIDLDQLNDLFLGYHAFLYRTERESVPEFVKEVKQGLQELESIVAKVKKTIHGVIDTRPQVFPKDITNIIIGDYLFGDVAFFKMPKGVQRQEMPLKITSNTQPIYLPAR